MRIPRLYFLVGFALISFLGCKREAIEQPVSVEEIKEESLEFKTKNVVIVMVDGPRFSETWGDPSHQYIPNMANHMAKEGIIYSNFYNNGVTFTNPGHTAISTGNYQDIDNGGNELPQNPSVFQYFIESKEVSPEKTWVIASKDKLAVLSNCENKKWKEKYRPLTDCGRNGLGTGYRKDIVTYTHTINTLEKDHPKMVLINFRQPDYAGHGNDWKGYLNGIKSTDEYVYGIWKFLQEDPFYKGTTTLFVTNDHGRHLDGHKDGFRSHGDNCEGCKHINLYAFGPDFRKGVIEHTPREQIDISATIAKLLQFEMPTSKGKVLKELFIDQKVLN